MSATAIAQAVVQYAPQAISAAKSLVAKFAPQIATTVEAASQTISTVADSGIAQNILEARNLISSDTSVANKLFGLSTHLSETHPEIASKLEGYAIKLLHKTGLSDEELSFLHEHLTKISSSEIKSEENNTKPTVGPSAEDVHILIDLIARGGLDPSIEEGYIKTLNNQNVVPLKEVKQRLIEATEKYHPPEQVSEEPQKINDPGVEQSSSVSILDTAITEAQQKIVLEASKKIPVTVSNEKLSSIVEKFLPLEGTQESLGSLAQEQPNIFQTLTKIATGKTTSLIDYKTAVSGLLTVFGISLPENFSINTLHNQHELAIKKAETEPELEAKNPKPEPQKTNNTSSHLDSLVTNIRDVLVREVKGSSTLFGMAQRAVSAAKSAGITLPKSLEGMDDIGKVLDSLVLTDDFKSSLERSIKGERVDFQGASELQTRAFQIINWGVWSINKLPKVAIEYFPLAVNVMKWAMPFAHFIPGLGRLLSTTYPILDEVAKVIDKFQVEAENIRTACSAIKGESSNHSQSTKAETAQVVEPELATAQSAG